WSSTSNATSGPTTQGCPAIVCTSAGTFDPESPSSERLTASALAIRGFFQASSRTRRASLPCAPIDAEVIMTVADEAATNAPARRLRWCTHPPVGHDKKQRRGRGQSVENCGLERYRAAR